MTPLRFQQLHEDEWAELEAGLHMLAARRSENGVGGVVSSARTAMLYRKACEHLALARSRSYPAYLVDRLAHLTAEGHQLIYHQPEVGAARLQRLVAADFPRSVRRHGLYIAAAGVVFALPALVLGVLVYVWPEMILTVATADQAAEFEQMYSPAAASIGRARDASTDWVMFGYYIRNNIGVAFQCFAAGLFGGVGSLFFLAYNGAMVGAVAGYLTGRGLGGEFYTFIATHSAFELTAIVISGGAGLRLGHSLLAPGRLPRIESLVRAARDCVPLLYGSTAMLLIAAAIEAFWSSAGWLKPELKHVVAALCWTVVIAYLIVKDRPHAD